MQIEDATPSDFGQSSLVGLVNTLEPRGEPGRSIVELMRGYMPANFAVLLSTTKRCDFAK